MIGPVVAVPAPQVILDGLTNVSVTSNSGPATPSVFELSFTLSNTSPLQTLFLISGGSPIPLVRVMLIATINGTPEGLVDGFMTDHHIAPGTDSANSTLTVKGHDTPALMDFMNCNGFS